MPAAVEPPFPARSLSPGCVLLARYGAAGCGRFYWARVARVYRGRDGEQRCDVEWLRPRAGSQSDGRYVCEDGSDDTDHREALLVASDLIQRLGGRGAGSPAASEGWDAAAAQAPSAGPRPPSGDASGSPRDAAAPAPAAVAPSALPRGSPLCSPMCSSGSISRRNSEEFDTPALGPVTFQSFRVSAPHREVYWEEVSGRDEEIFCFKDVERGPHSSASTHLAAMEVLSEPDTDAGDLLSDEPPLVWPEIEEPLGGEPSLLAPQISAALQQEIIAEIVSGSSGLPGRLLANALGMLTATGARREQWPSVERPKEPAKEGQATEAESQLATKCRSSTRVESFASDSQLTQTFVNQLYTHLVEAASGVAVGRFLQAIGAMFPQLSCMDPELLAAGERASEFELHPERPQPCGELSI